MNFVKSCFRIIRLITLTALLSCLIIFMVNNRDTVNITLYPLPFAIETRMFLVMASFFIFGMLFGVLIYSKSLIKNLVSKFKDEKKIKKLEKQINKN